MDLREEVVAFRGHYRETFNWILQAGGTRSVVLAMGDRFPLLLLAQVLVRPMKLRAAVTTEAEARASVGCIGRICWSAPTGWRAAALCRWFGRPARRCPGWAC